MNTSGVRHVYSSLSLLAALLYIVSTFDRDVRPFSRASHTRRTTMVNRITGSAKRSLFFEKKGNRVRTMKRKMRA